LSNLSILGFLTFGLKLRETTRWRVEAEDSPVELASLLGNVRFSLSDLVLISKKVWNFSVNTILIGDLCFDGPWCTCPGFACYSILEK